MLIWSIKNWQGGLADSKDEGIEFSSAYLQGINFRSNSRAITVNQALKKISGTTVVDKIIKFVEVGSNIFGFGDGGNIYKITNDTVTKVYTDTNKPILDAGYFYDKLYWTTGSKLSRVNASSTNWDTDVEHDWQTLETSSYHNIFTIGNRMFIGNGRYVATVSNTGAFVNNSLDLEKDWEVRCLNLIKPLLLIGIVNNGRSKIVAWDFINAADSWEDIPGLEEGIITDFREIAGGLMVFIGKKIFYYNGINNDPLYTFDDTIAHGSHTIYDNMIYLATKKGVYSFGKKNRNYPTVPNLEYITSQGVNVDAIGAIHGTSSTLYVAWKKGLTYGIDMIDVNTKQAQGILETLVLSEKGTLRVEKAEFFFDKLPANTSIQIKYKKDGDVDWQVIKDPDGNALITTSNSLTKDKVPLGFQCKTLQFQILLNSSGNNAPTFRGIEVYIDIV